MIRLGIIGCGYWGPNLVRNFSEVEGAEVEVVCDTRPGRLDFIRNRHKRIQTTTDYKEILNSPIIDAVCIATPPATHYQIAMEAIEAGKHILVEKPLAMEAREAEAIDLAARRKGMQLMVGHVFLYAPAIETMRRMVLSGELGELYYISSTRANLGPPNTVVDVLWDLAPHDVSIILDLIGESPVEIYAHGASFTNSNVAETVFITMRFPSGKMGHVHVSWLTPNKTRVLHMVCKERVVMYDDMELVEKVRVYEAGVDTRAKKNGEENGVLVYGPGSITIPSLSTQEPLRAECEDFIRAIKTGEEPRSGGRWGVEVVKVLDTASRQIQRAWLESPTDNKTVAIP